MSYLLWCNSKQWPEKTMKHFWYVYSHFSTHRKRDTETRRWQTLSFMGKKLSDVSTEGFTHQLYNTDLWLLNIYCWSWDSSHGSSYVVKHQWMYLYVHNLIYLIPLCYRAQNKLETHQWDALLNWMTCLHYKNMGTVVYLHTSP